MATLASRTSTATRMAKIVQPHHTNSTGSAFGGWLLKQLDLAAFNAAQRHHRGASPPVTVSIDDVQFLNQLKAGHVLTTDARVTRTFGSSMEVQVTMFGEDPADPGWSLPWPVLRSYATFVAMGEDGRSAQVEAFRPGTDEELEAYEAAGTRRSDRLKRRSSASDSLLVLGETAATGGRRSSSPCYADTYVEMVESIFSKHTNARGLGGMILAASDEVAFLRPVRHGDTVVVGSEVTGSWNHSLEVGLSIEREDPGSGERESCLTAFFSSVATASAK